jgi:hypothetical protein
LPITVMKKVIREVGLKLTFLKCRTIADTRKNSFGSYILFGKFHQPNQFKTFY